MEIKTYNRILRIYLKKPSYIIFHPTVDCNCDCNFCYTVKRPKNSKENKDLSLDEIEKISKKFNPFAILTISGGEPFLRDDISEIIKIFYKNNKLAIVSIATNGSFPKKIEKQVKEVLKNCPNLILKVSVSIDDIKEKHDIIRKHKGLFNKAIKTYKKLEKLKIYPNLKLDVSTTISSSNQSRVKEILNELKNKYNLNVPGIAFLHGPKSSEVSIDKYSELLKISKDKLYYKTNKEILKRRKTKKRGKCYAIKKFIFIDNKGNVYPCEPLKKKIGNLRENNYDIKEILESKKAKEILKSINDKKCNCLWCNAIIFNYIINPLRIIFD